jgi:hypothetical protein
MCDPARMMQAVAFELFWAHCTEKVPVTVSRRRRRSLERLQPGTRGTGERPVHSDVSGARPLVDEIQVQHPRTYR